MNKTVLSIFLEIIIFLFAISCEKDKPADTNLNKQIKFSSPTNNDTIEYGQNLKISIDVGNSNTSINKLVLVIDKKIRFETDVEPFEYNWNTNYETLGKHRIYSRIIDRNGEVTTDSVEILLKGISPEVITAPMSFVGISYAKAEGEIKNLGYPAITSCGICWDTNPNPLINNSKQIVENKTGSFNVQVKDLNKGTTYYLRAFATNSDTSIYGNEITFTTVSNYYSDTGTFVDATTQKRYKWVSIGTQTWMAENLRGGSNEVDPVFGDYYGSGTCPVDWHIPNANDWQTLIDYLGGNDDAGRHLKSSLYWKESNEEATNFSLFNALPGGIYSGAENDLKLLELYESAYFKVDNDNHNSNWYRLVELHYNSKAITISDSRANFGYDTKYFNIRCIKDSK